MARGLPHRDRGEGRRLALKTQGRILGRSRCRICMAPLITACAGMYGTAATQAAKLKTIVRASIVEVIRDQRPVIRIDHPKWCFRRRREKGRGGAREQCAVLCTSTGRPVDWYGERGGIGNGLRAYFAGTSAEV